MLSIFSWNNCRKLAALLLIVALFGHSTPAQAGNIVRTMIYHQITGPTDLFGSSPISPILNANGTRAVFTLPPQGTGDPQQPNRIFVISPEGSGFQQVDAYTSLVFSGSYADISADGGKIVSTDSVQIRSVNGNGSGPTPLVALDSNEINDLTISGDGSKVFFRVYRNTSVRGSNPSIPFQSGIWVINSNGTGLRQIVGPAQIAALLGLTEDAAGFFGSDTAFSCLKSSNDGSRLVFASMVNPQSGGVGQRLFGVNLDGSGLHDFFGQLDFAFQSTISADGSKVGYTVQPLNSNVHEGGIVNFDGSGKVKLTDSTDSHSTLGAGFYLSRLQLNTNGTKLFISDLGLLYNTDGSGVIALGLGGHGDPSDMVYDGLTRATMNGAANKFLYIFQPPNEPYQFARLDLNPTNIGNAPALTQPLIDPTYVLTNSGSSATLTARANAAVTQIGNRVLLNGVPDINTTTAFRTPLLDNGTGGDAVAGDGIFTNNTLATNCCAAVGPRLVRFKDEIKDSGGKRHATAIDFEPFEVRDTLPPLPGASINDISVAEGNDGTVNATFTVRLASAAIQTTKIDFATADGNAVSPADYTSLNGTLTFAIGETTKTLTVVVRGDFRDEANEQFTVNLSNPIGATITDGQGVGTIRDDDAPPTFSINDITVAEGTGASVNAVFTVTLSAPSGQTTGITCATADGTAKAPGDYTPARVNLSLAPGETSKTFTVEVKGDALDEVTENFFALLSTPINAGVLHGRGIATITDDDAPPSLSVADVSVQEGHTGTRVAAFIIKLSAASGQIVRVNFATANNTAIAGSAASSGDYTAVPSTQVSFGIGATAVLARVVINGDTVDEPNENFLLNLTNPVNATIADGQAFGTIVDDDPTPNLTINNASITEGSTGTKLLNFTVTLNGKTSQAVGVKYATSNGSATAGSDYVGKTGSLNFAVGETTKTISITINGDTTVENNETFFVLLSAPTNAVIGVGRGTGTITNDDSAPPQAQTPSDGSD